MKKATKRIMAAVCAGCIVLPAAFMAACGGTGNGHDKDVDESKTQIYVYTYKRGFGDEWLYNLEQAFEEKYATTSFEEGKTGVQVWHTSETTEPTAADIRAGRYDVYFMENADYYGIKNAGGALGDITEIVTQASSVDGKTISSKLSDAQKVFFGGSVNDEDAQYYALPHYKGGYGLVYNVELFDEMGYYIAQDGTVIGTSAKQKSTGPDGKTGVIDGIDYSADDGLPATYAQFLTLCRFISNTGNVPLCWPGGYYDQHLNHLFNALVAEYEGVDGMNLNVTFDSKGEAVDDLVVIENGAVKKENGKIVTESLPIGVSNGYDVMRQAGKYYALEFLREIMTTSDYYAADSYTTAFSQTDNQQLFIQAGTDLDAAGNSGIAMLVDGSWWQSESTDVFTAMAKKDEKYSVTNRKFAWMPLPKATEEKIGSESVMMDMLNSIVCVKAGLGSNRDAVLEFVKYSCSDEALVQFTQTTGALKNFNYGFTQQQQSGLSYYTKSLIAYNEKATTYSFAGNGEFYLSHRSEFLPMNVNKSNVAERPTIAFHENKVSSAEAYFTDMYKYWKSRNIWNG